MVPGMPYTAAELVRALFQISMLLSIKNSRAITNTVRIMALILVDLDVEVKLG